MTNNQNDPVWADSSVKYWSDLADREFEQMHDYANLIDERLKKGEPIGPLIAELVRKEMAGRTYSNRMYEAMTKFHMQELEAEYPEPKKKSFIKKLFRK